MKLKIAVFHNLPKGGAIKALSDNCRYLKDKGHVVDVYIPDTADESFAPLVGIADNYYVYPVKRSKFRTFILNTTEKIIPSFNVNKDSELYIKFNDFKKTQKKIANDINKRDYDIVISEQDFTFTHTPAFLKYIEKPAIYSCPQPPRKHDKILNKLNDNFGSFFSRLYAKYEKKYLKLDIEHAQYCDNILVNSYFTHENVLQIYGMNSQVSYLGVDTDLFHPMDVERKNYVLSVGNLKSHKGFDFIIKSLGKVEKDIRPILKIVGYASSDKWLNYLKELADLNDVEFEVLEGISYEELVVLYNEAKIVLFAPYLEPFGLVPLEALACGTPVIGVREGGVRETVKHNVNGLLLDRDEEVFAEGITTLLTNQELWLQFSENSSNYINSYWTLNHGGARFLNHIYRVLEKEKGE